MKRRSDEEISAPLYEYDAAVRSQYGCFAGVDEAGRGPLCGPAEAVDRPKQRRLIRAAQYYLQQNGLSDAPVRFDVAEVFPLDSGRWMVHIIRGAFLA